MPAQIKAGAILRRGTDRLSPEQLSELLTNPKKVQSILDDIEKRRTVFLNTEKTTTAATAKLEKKEDALAGREAKLLEDAEAVEKKRREAKNELDAGMGALGRRTREVEGRETAAAERHTALDARGLEIEDNGRARETEFAERESVIEDLEATAETREQTIIADNRRLEEDKTNIQTVAKLIRTAAEQLARSP